MIEQDIQQDTNEEYKSSFRQYLRFCELRHIPPLSATQLTVLYWMAFRTTEVQASSILTNYYGIALFCDFKFGEKFGFSNAIAIFNVLIQLSQGRKL